MAQRLATVYVKTCLMLTEAEMLSFIQLFKDHEVLSRVKVLENGSQEVVFADGGDDEISLTFDRVAGTYVCKGTCRLTSPKLTNLMRKAVSTYKGDAIVNRMYTGYTMVYHYSRGSVVRIVEVKGNQEKLIYEYQDTLGQLEMLFRKTEVELEIGTLHDQINQLLDLRFDSADSEFHRLVDERLKKLTHRLFVLEA